MRVQDGPKHCGDLSTEWDKLMRKFGYTWTSKQGQGTFSGSKSSQDGLATDAMLNPDSIMEWLTLSCPEEQVRDSAHFQTTVGTCLWPCWPTPLKTSLADSLTVLVFNSPAPPLCNLLVKIPLSGHILVQRDGSADFFCLGPDPSVSLIYLSMPLFNDTVNIKTAKSTLHPVGTPASGTAMSGHGGTSSTDKYLGRVQLRPGKGKFGNFSCYLDSVLIFSFVTWNLSNTERIFHSLHWTCLWYTHKTGPPAPEDLDPASLSQWWNKKKHTCV